MDISLESPGPRARGFLLPCASAATSPGRQAVGFLLDCLRYSFRRQRETLVGRVTSNAPLPSRMRFSRTVPLLAPHAVWRRPLSVDKCSSLMTYAEGPQMNR